MKIKELVHAAGNLNNLLFDPKKKEDGWIDIDTTKEDLEVQVKDAALWLVATDTLEDVTVKVLKEMKWEDSDFTNLEEDQKPLPLFHKYGIVEKPAEEVPVEKPKKKPAAKKKETKKADPEPEPEPEEEVVPDPESEQHEDDENPDEESVEEHMEDPAKTKVKKPKVYQVVDGFSAYSTAFAFMSTDPEMSMADLYEMIKVKGFDLAKVGNSVKTARSAFRKVFVLLDRQGYIKKKK